MMAQGERIGNSKRSADLYSIIKRRNNCAENVEAMRKAQRQYQEDMQKIETWTQSNKEQFRTLQSRSEQACSDLRDLQAALKKKRLGWHNLRKTYSEGRIANLEYVLEANGYHAGDHSSQAVIDAVQKGIIYSHKGNRYVLQIGDAVTSAITATLSLGFAVGIPAYLLCAWPESRALPLAWSHMLCLGTGGSMLHKVYQFTSCQTQKNPFEQLASGIEERTKCIMQYIESIA
jgi:hypothetical protein